MTAETLRCRCGVEVRVVRLTPQTLALGHVVNPRNHHHPVALARDAADRSSARTRATFEGIGRIAGNATPTEPSIATRGARERTSRSRNTPSGIATQRTSGARIESGSAPHPLTLRAPLGAGGRS